MNDAVKAATSKLWDYINGLPPEQRERAIEYQSKLESMALVTEGGMAQVILNEARHHTAVLEELADEVNEIVARQKTDNLLNKVM